MVAMSSSLVSFTATLAVGRRLARLFVDVVDT